jgi:beta-galactosidase
MIDPLLPAARVPTPFTSQTALIHGGDYNPDQWMYSTPTILDDDAKLMKLAGINSASIAIFSWTKMEPSEGKYEFGWLDAIMDQQAKLGNKVVLATPTGAMPAWLSAKYPDARRVDRNARGIRNQFRDRHNHCWSSPSYHARAAAINAQLAERYKSHPALAMWHVSNELNGECFCDLCRARFAGWLERRYGSLDKVNDAYWAGFWSKLATKWTEIEPTDFVIDGMQLDWLRFSNDQLIAWYRHEASVLRPITPNVPITTNFMGTMYAMNYIKLGTEVDVVCDDQYPRLDPDSPTFARSGAFQSFKNDMYRSMLPRGGKRRSFFLMESCPGAVQWVTPQKLKRPGVHRLEMLQAVAAGADGTSYFQFRAGRGAFEKLHGAVVEHAGTELAPQTRIFKGVQELSQTYAKLTGLLGTSVNPEVAIVYDWESKWAQKLSQGTGVSEHRFTEVAGEQYQPFWQMGIPVDVIANDRDFSPYKLLILPQHWIVTPETAAKIRAYVENGGVVVATWDTGMADESNRMLQGGTPGNGLTDVFGLWVEETDRLDVKVTRKIAPKKGDPMKLPAKLAGFEVAALANLTTARAFATFDEDFYKGRPALTHNRFGKGHACFIATRLDEASAFAYYKELARMVGLTPIIDAPLPYGVSAQLRGAGTEAYAFLLNFSAKPQTVKLGTRTLKDLETGKTFKGTIKLDPVAARVFALTVAPAKKAPKVAPPKKAGKKR